MARANELVKIAGPLGGETRGRCFGEDVDFSRRLEILAA